MTVKVFDPQMATWSTLKTYGKAPVGICYSSFYACQSNYLLETS